MPSSIPYTFYTFFFQTWDEVVKALEDALKAKDALVKKNLVGVRSMYEHIEGIKYVLVNHDMEDPVWPVDQQIIQMLDTALMRQFLAKPEDKITRDAVALQLVMISFALGLMKEVEPYTPAELWNCLTEQTDFYSDEVFAYTLRQVMRGYEVEQMVPLIMWVLSKDAKEADAPHDWYAAMIYMLMLQTVWTHVRYMGGSDQLFLMEHYLYCSIVSGVPVKLRLQDALRDLPQEEEKQLYTQLNQSVSRNVEQVPISFPDTQETFASLVMRYKGQYAAKLSDAFSQNEFVQGLYKGRSQADFWIKWLREVVNIAVHLQSADLTKVSKK